MIEKSRHIAIIDFVKVPALMTVILIHCNFTEDHYSAALRHAPQFNILLEFLQRNIYSVAVPLFYFISGYLFFRDGVPDTGGYMAKWKRRIHSLLIPYLLWNIAGLLLFLLKKTPALEWRFPLYSDMHVDLVTLLKGFYILPVEDAVGPYDFVLWFIRNLLIILPFTPVIGYMFRYLRFMGLIVIIAIGWWWEFEYYSIGAGFMFFSIGGYCALLIPDLQTIVRHTGLVLAVWIICICGQYLAGTAWMEAAATVAGIFFFISVGGWFVEKGFRWPQVITTSLFFVYACHGLYASVVRSAVAGIINPAGNLTSLLCYLMIFSVDVAVALLLYLLMRRFAPKLTAVLSGGR
ncbi:MAG: acyltransferase [Muribaculaceae bacterium]|nr:acyltransferase [Muribaculaceae bacterium]